EEFEEKEETQEEEDDMEVDIEEDENEPELTYPYEEVDPLNPSVLASESEAEDVIEVKDTVESEDKIVPASVHEKSVDAAIAAERARHANAGNDARGSRPVKGQDAAPAVRECTFAGFMKCNPTVFMIATIGLDTMNQMPWTEMKELMTTEFYPVEEIQRMEHELWHLKVKEYNIMAYTQRFNELALMCPRIVEPKRMKVDVYIQGLSDNIKCHKYGKVGHKARYCKEKSVATGANAQPILTCYDCGEQGHTRNRCSKKVKQEETGEVRGQAYTIKDAEP
nr:hypothetical protein [Tanacetum cinerariifolium]GFA29689.1 hypothetical protein [Tanacetum cinerariifolium]